MAKIAYLDEEDRRLLNETKQKLDEATKLMAELMETIEILSDPAMMKEHPPRPNGHQSRTSKGA